MAANKPVVVSGESLLLLAFAVLFVLGRVQTGDFVSVGQSESCLSEILRPGTSHPQGKRKQTLSSQLNSSRLQNLQGFVSQRFSTAISVPDPAFTGHARGRGSASVGPPGSGSAGLLSRPDAGDRRFPRLQIQRASLPRRSWNASKSCGRFRSDQTR